MRLDPPQMILLLKVSFSAWPNGGPGGLPPELIFGHYVQEASHRTLVIVYVVVYVYLCLYIHIGLSLYIYMYTCIYVFPRPPHHQSGMQSARDAS